MMPQLLPGPNPDQSFLLNHVEPGFSFLSWGSTAQGWRKGCWCHKDKLKPAFRNACSGVHGPCHFSSCPMATCCRGRLIALVPHPRRTCNQVSPSPKRGILPLWGPASREALPLTHLKRASQSAEPSQTPVPHVKETFPWFCRVVSCSLPTCLPPGELCLYFCNLRMCSLKMYISQSCF